MRRIVTISLLAVLSVISVRAQTKMEFIVQDWNMALEKAREQSKFIVLDAYTEWCGWCKVMDKNTFSDSSVTAFYSDRFIAVKIDMEKGVGVDLAMKYRVSGFPSILYFDPEGRLVYRSIGYRKVDEFLQDGREALEATRQFRHPGDPKVLDPGFPQFYKESFLKGKERKWPMAATVNEFLMSQGDLFSEVSWSVMSRFPLSNEMNSHFLENMARYAVLFGQLEVDDKLSDIVSGKVQEALKANDRAVFDEGMAIMRRYANPKDTAAMAIGYSMYYFSKAGDWASYSAMAIRESKNESTSNATLNQYAWNIFENVSDKSALTAARNWMKGVVESEPTYAYLDTYAALLYKLGQYKEAEKQALKAIETGIAAKEDVDGTKELLGKIREKK